MAAPSLFPIAQTTIPGTFSAQSDGMIQGTFMDDPAVRNFLVGGIVGTSETNPMYGGIAIQEAVPNPTNQNDALGGVITRAAGYPNVTGFTVFTQAHAMVVQPGSTVPLAGSGMQVNLFRMGSGARIVVGCSAALAAALEGNAINQQVSWDFVNQVLIAFNTTALPVKVINVNVGNSKTVITTGLPNAATWNPSGSTALIQI